MLTDYSLSFLCDLGHAFTDEDVERIWCNRVFPLVFTDDFTTNWSAVRDPNGIFVASTGARCRVEPQPHHVPRCQVVIRQGGTVRQERISYDAIIFAKVVHQLFLNSSSNSPKGPVQVQRRQFVDQFVRKLPSQWRSLIIYGDLHHYNERSDQILWSIKPDLYSPLASSQSIRLVALLPNCDYNAPIECTMYEADFASGPKYEALSYVWGAPDSMRKIRLNGEMVSIRENLEAALRQLRPRGTEPRTMWVDSICINQSNVEERTEQVKHMDTIYRNATGVVVWIGRESNTSARVFEVFNEWRRVRRKGLEELLGSQHFLKFPFQPEPYCPECDGVPHAVPAPLVGTYVDERHADSISRAARSPDITRQQWKDHHTEDIEALVTLLERPWWRRVWVLQEAILAKKLTLHCGSGYVDWPTFQGVLYTILRQSKRSRAHHLCTLTREARRGRAAMKLLVSANSTFAFFFLQSSSLAARQLQGLSMADLLSLTWNFDATDARDKLFALIGLLPENSPERIAFKPDYTSHVQQLYTYVAKTFLEASRRLDVLTARPAPPFYFRRKPAVGTQDREFEGPSWAPNWELPQLWQLNSIWISDFSQFKTLDWYMRSYSHDHHSGCGSADGESTTDESLQVFNASLHKTSPFDFGFSAYDEILHARGVLVDIIEEVGQPWDLARAVLRTYDPEDPDRSRGKAHDAQISIIDQWKSIARLDEEGEYPFTEQPRREAFWRTLLLDRYRSNSRDGHNYRILRLPSEIGEKEGADIFGPAGIKCVFPPQNSDDEGWLVYFLRHEATELWSFASVNLHCVNLSLFRTKKGYIGMGHPNVQPGDKVTVLLGAPVPLVLREYAEGHLLIGQRFVTPHSIRRRPRLTDAL